MNEQKRNTYNYFNPEQNKKQQTSDELIAMIRMFMSRNTLHPKDCIVLQKMLKQLMAQRNNLPNKVIRAITNKFEKITEKYQKARI